MSRVPIVQKLNSNTERNPLCTDSIAITDFETGEVFCQNCGIVLQDSSGLHNRGRSTGIIIGSR